MNTKLKKTVVSSFLALVLSALAVLGVLNFGRNSEESGEALSMSVENNTLLATQETMEQALAKGEKMCYNGREKNSKESAMKNIKKVKKF